MTLTALGVEPNLHATLEEAFAVGRKGTLTARLLHAAHAWQSHLALDTTYAFNSKQSKVLLREFAAEIDVTPVKAGAQCAHLL